MIIKDKTQLHSVEEQGDNLIFTHVQDVAPTMQAAQMMREFSDNGFTDDRSMRLVAKIPEAEFHDLMRRNPDVAKDGKELLRWVKSSEAAPYRTVRQVDTGRSGKIIIK